MSTDRRARLVPRLRVMRGSTILLGPGKADLLEAIDQRGSIREAAGVVGMSYMRAWKLVQVMNDGFREPLVVVHRGGSARGGAELTSTGKAALKLYRRLESDALRASKRAWAQLEKLLDSRDT
jgi:molybdate transport system regulatory protein